MIEPIYRTLSRKNPRPLLGEGLGKLERLDCFPVYVGEEIEGELREGSRAQAANTPAVSGRKPKRTVTPPT